MTADQWRQNEAEARQEMPQRTCSNCGDTHDDCDTFQCTECKEYFCHECWLANSANVCYDCLEKEDTFNEVADESPHKEWIHRQAEKDEYAVVNAERDQDDRMTGHKED